MNQTTSKQVRILALAPTARGFGYCVMENDVMLECGHKEVWGNKNVKSISRIKKLMKQFLPDVLVLQDVSAKGCRRVRRTKALHLQIITLATKETCKVKFFAGKVLRNTLLGDVEGTRHEMAETLAKIFPVELAMKLPRKRRFYDSEDGRMDMFDALGLAVVFRMKLK
jgi:hypothetical protein